MISLECDAFESGGTLDVKLELVLCPEVVEFYRIACIGLISGVYLCGKVEAVEVFLYLTVVIAVVDKITCAYAVQTVKRSCIS